MSKVIDLRLNCPLTAEKTAETVIFYVLNRDAPGVANYSRIFGPQLAASLGATLEELTDLSRKLTGDELSEFVLELAQKTAVSPEEFEKQLDEAGIEWGLIDIPEGKDGQAIWAQLPARIKGVAVFDPHNRAKSLSGIERAIKKSGYRAVYVSPYLWGLRADDRRFYPCYAKALELDVPVFVYTAMSYRNDLPMDIGRPLYLDRVAVDFPDLRLIARCGGWPWVPELIGVARRHRNVYIDTSSHRPKYLATPGSGFEMLMQFGNTLLQDRIVFASGAGDLGLPIGQIVQEMKELPLKEEVREKWLYKNALELFRLS